MSRLPRPLCCVRISGGAVPYLMAAAGALNRDIVGFHNMAGAWTVLAA